MRLCFVLALAAIGLVGADLSAPVRAQNLPCDAFVRNADGSWTAVQEVRVPAAGRVFNVRAGSVLRPGATMMGLDMAALLAQECSRVPVGLPATAPPPPASVSESSTALSKLTDANGLIDAQQLTCGQLADAASADADLLLLWYSGWYNAAAKKRVLDLPRTKEAIRNVLLYCKANRDKRVVQAMDLYLKDVRR
jgi:hypothetical protein